MGDMRDPGSIEHLFAMVRHGIEAEADTTCQRIRLRNRYIDGLTDALEFGTPGPHRTAPFTVREKRDAMRRITGA